MPTITPQQDPEKLEMEPELPQQPAAPPDSAGPRADDDAPLSFVPHLPRGSEPARIHVARYGEMDEQTLVHLLDSIEDERARGRFRESIYISVFVWMVIAWVVLYGPRYLWHAPQLINPGDVLKQREMVQLNAPRLAPTPRPPAAKTKLDTKTLEKLRAMSPAKPAPAPTPTPAQPTPAPPAASSPPPPPTPQPRPTQPLVDAPTPQPSTKPNFGTPGTASDQMKSLLNDSSRGHTAGSGSHDTMRTEHGGGTAGGGVEVLSDMQGVDFSDYLRRLKRDIYRNWIPLLPEETEPPLLKQGETYIRFTILPNGEIGGMALEGRSGDVAIDKAAWGSILSEGQFPPLPTQFHGPNLELRFHYMVNKGIR